MQFEILFSVRLSSFRPPRRGEITEKMRVRSSVALSQDVPIPLHNFVFELIALEVYRDNSNGPQSVFISDLNALIGTG